MEIWDQIIFKKVMGSIDIYFLFACVFEHSFTVGRQVNSVFTDIMIRADRVVKDNLPAAQTWRWNLPSLHVNIKYEQKSQMKYMSHKFN